MSPEVEKRLRDDYSWVLPCEVSLTDVLDGWYTLLNHTLAFLLACSQSGRCTPVTIHRIYRQYRVLQIEYVGGDDRVRGATDLAMSLSVLICEVCGNRVLPRRLHYHYPRCIAHYDEDQKVEIFITEPPELPPAPNIIGLESEPKPKRELKLRFRAG